MSTELFKPTASPPEDALVLIFDLEGFSHFFSQPEVHRYVPKYLNTIFEAVDIAIYDRPDYWLEDSPSEQQTAAIPAPLAAPIHFKFMGDGGLYIWKMSDPQNSKNLLNFVNRLWNLKINFDKVVLRALEEIPVADVPKKIRIGLAAGSVYKPQKTKQQAQEYIGYAINLASRLQSYCRELGFVYSARLGINKAKLLEFQYRKVIATNLRGFPQEIVVVDENEYKELSSTIKSQLFKTIA